MLTPRRLLFFWSTSFALALGAYGALWLVMPYHWVYGAPYRMHLYHWAHPVQYMLIPCFFFGLVASRLLDRFARCAGVLGRLAMTAVVVGLTLVASMPFGGMLWHLHDMLAGYFPEGWLEKLLVRGAQDGLAWGWYVVLLSVPYNVLGVAAAFGLLRAGARRFTAAGAA